MRQETCSIRLSSQDQTTLTEAIYTELSGAHTKAHKTHSLRNIADRSTQDFKWSTTMISPSLNCQTRISQLRACQIDRRNWGKCLVPQPQRRVLAGSEKRTTYNTWANLATRGIALRTSEQSKDWALDGQTDLSHDKNLTLCAPVITPARLQPFHL
jgi:hypothetical protein